MRIDRLLCELNIGTRSEVKALLKKGQILVSGEVITKPETKVDEQTAIISYKGATYRYQPFVYYLLNKPDGVISASNDSYKETVLDLLGRWLKENGKEIGVPFKDIFPIGRLDQDTVGLLLLTNDGALAHELLSPKKHVEKCYYVELNQKLSLEQCDRLCHGVDIGENELTKEAKLQQLTDNSCYLTITEGKYHQVKRMFLSVGLTVVFLKRVRMGNLKLPDQLAEGDILELTKEEVLRGIEA